MADIAIADVSYVVVPLPKGSRIVGRPARFENVVTVTFGNGVLTYPTNGVPLRGTGLGMPSNVTEVVIVFSQFGGTRFWTYDQGHNTLRGFTFSTGAELTGGVTAVPATTVEVLAIGY